MDMEIQEFDSAVSGMKNKWNFQKVGGCNVNKQATEIIQ